MSLEELESCLNFRHDSRVSFYNKQLKSCKKYLVMVIKKKKIESEQKIQIKYRLK